MLPKVKKTNLDLETLGSKMIKLKKELSINPTFPVTSESKVEPSAH